MFPLHQITKKKKKEKKKEKEKKMEFCDYFAK